ncbi:MAG: hypothetical protein HY718_11675 [Planctomycetes bacterium]|nr:hypothetical protein [Planctomycetota bacterium]
MEQLLGSLRQLEQELGSAPDPDWVVEWKAKLVGLLAKLKGWLKPAIEGKPPLVEWTDLEVAISETEGEVYKAPGARLIGPKGRFVEIVPKARHIFNAMGRVDLVSRRGRAMLARFAPDEWSFVWTSADGRWESAKLTEDSFAEVLSEMLG